jgi:predicted dehydrogenase
VRLGFIGGGSSSFIGPVHRTAAAFDGCLAIVAGSLSSDPGRAVAEANAAGLRGYPDAAAMIAAEARRPDGIDAVAIVTPNDSHHFLIRMALEAGLDVICDKPLTNDTATAADIVALAETRRRTVALTHPYSAYAMLREARAAVAAGEIGGPRLASVRYLQGGLSLPIELDPDLPARSRWRLDPARGGRSHVLADIGVHAIHLLSFVTGRRPLRVCGRAMALAPHRLAHDTAVAMIDLDDGLVADVLVTKVASGAENAVSIELYGESGGMTWQQSSPDHLRITRQGRPVEIRAAGMPTLHTSARSSTRLPLGHPEGFYGAFASLYAEFALAVAGRLAGVNVPVPDLPTHRDGWLGLAVIDAWLASGEDGGWRDVARLTTTPGTRPER